MCKHRRLVYIGDQELMDNKSMPLYNCLDCYTTLSKNSILKIKLAGKGKPFKALIRSH